MLIYAHYSLHKCFEPMTKIHFAPVQGHTDAPYRHYHAQRYVPADTYYTPFIRLEHGEIRKKDLNDLKAASEYHDAVVPQVIFRDYEELAPLVATLAESGYSRIDINMGCPFPLQTAKGRGAATSGKPEAALTVAHVTGAYPEVSFSVKMRLGLTDPYEWRNTLPILNDLSLCHIAMHPRIGKQQYKGEPDMEAFTAFMEEATVPVVYNGDILTPEDCNRILSRFPNLAGIMIGRGLLGRPSLTSEIREGVEWDEARRIREMLAFHRDLLNHYRDSLCGDHQILSKIQPFWEYAEQEIGRKNWKALQKAVNMAKYTTALASLSHRD